MSFEAAIDLGLCGLLIVCLSLLARYLFPPLPFFTLGVGLMGGAICILFSLIMRCSPIGWWGALTVLALMGLVFALQAVRLWATSVTDESKSRIVAVIMAAMVAFCAGMIANLVKGRKVSSS